MKIGHIETMKEIIQDIKMLDDNYERDPDLPTAADGYDRAIMSDGSVVPWDENLDDDYIAYYLQPGESVDENIMYEVFGHPVIEQDTEE